VVVVKKTIDKLGMALNGYYLKIFESDGGFYSSQLDEHFMLSEDCF
jgi:hypothetical protein